MAELNIFGKLPEIVKQPEIVEQPKEQPEVIDEVQPEVIDEVQQEASQQIINEMKGGEHMFHNFISTLNNPSLNKNDKYIGVINNINGMNQVSHKLSTYKDSFPKSSLVPQINNFLEKYRRSSADALNSFN